MILDPNLYKMSLDKMKDTIVEGAQEGGKFDILTILSLGSHIPFAAVISYAMRSDVFGKTPELEQVYNSAINFFSYDNVIPWNDL